MNGANQKEAKRRREAFDTVARTYEEVGEPHLGQLLLRDKNRVIDAFLSGEMADPANTGPTLVTGPAKLEWVKPNGSYSRTHLVETWKENGEHELYCGITASDNAVTSEGHDKVCERCRTAYSVEAEKEEQEEVAA